MNLIFNILTDAMARRMSPRQMEWVLNDLRGGVVDDHTYHVIDEYFKFCAASKKCGDYKLEMNE